MIRETFTLVLMTFIPLSTERVTVHVERQSVKGLSKAECEAYKKEARREGVKAQCLRR